MDSYKTNFFSNLYKQFQANSFYDVYLICDDGSKFGAHKIVLSSSCLYFKSMFECGLAEIKNNLVYIRNIETEVFHSLLNFIYSGEVKLDEDTVELILRASDFFGLTEVVNECCEFLRNRFCPTNIIGILELSRQFAFKCLEREAILYMTLNFSEVLNSEEFIKMPFESLQLCLSLNDLCIKSEQQLFEACMRWIGHDINARLVFFKEICSLLRLPLLSLDFLQEFSSRCPHKMMKSHLKTVMDDHLHCRQVSSIKSSADLISVCSIHRKIVGASAFVIGGNELRQWSDHETFNSILSFDSSLQQFSNDRSISLHQPRSGHCVAVVDRRVYIFGGERCLLMVDSVECWESHKDSSEVVSFMPCHRWKAGAVAVSNMVYLFGGQNESESVERRIDVFNTWSNCWQESKCLPDDVVPCHSQGVVYHEGLVYLIGGINEQGVSVPQCVAFNPVTESFETLAPLRMARAAFGIACLNNHVYVAGGMHHMGSALTLVEKYSISQNKWETVGELKQGRFNTCMACLAGNLYLFGGEASDGGDSPHRTLSSIERYDPVQDEWSLVESGLCSRSSACVAVL